MLADELYFHWSSRQQPKLNEVWATKAKAAATKQQWRNPMLPHLWLRAHRQCHQTLFPSSSSSSSHEFIDRRVVVVAAVRRHTDYHERATERPTSQPVVLVTLQMVPFFSPHQRHALHSTVPLFCAPDSMMPTAKDQRPQQQQQQQQQQIVGHSRVQ